MGFMSDMKILYHMLLRPVRGKNHAQRMESFYGGQAQGYDDFRKRLLKGREELFAALPRPPEGIWVDLGGGTGSNIENLAEHIGDLKKVYVVDLSTSLLKIASERFAEKGWSHVEAVEYDATRFTPAAGAADVVTFSYSLTMIPNWFAAIENALRILKPGGTIGVVDFYVSRKFPDDGLRRHRWFTRTLWPNWFATDNVFPSADHLPFLRHHFDQQHLQESKSKVPYTLFLKTPYYIFVGKKPPQPNQNSSEISLDREAGQA
jgi:S-adenosylmethionine-diacylgycerolhomoserine-N-methlytransferase